jgi:hypothetical protein
MFIRFSNFPCLEGGRKISGNFMYTHRYIKRFYLNVPSPKLFTPILAKYLASIKSFHSGSKKIEFVFFYPDPNHMTHFPESPPDEKLLGSIFCL